MPSKKQLKKEINDILGALIEEVYVKELSTEKLDLSKSEAIIDEAIALFDELIQSMHAAPEQTAKQHFKAIRLQLTEKSSAISAKIKAL